MRRWANRGVVRSRHTRTRNERLHSAHERLVMHTRTMAFTVYSTQRARPSILIAPQVHSIPTTTPDETLGACIAWLEDNKPFVSIGIASFGPVDLNKDSKTYGHITTTPKPHWGMANVVGPFEKFGEYNWRAIVTFSAASLALPAFLSQPLRSFGVLLDCAEMASEFRCIHTPTLICSAHGPCCARNPPLHMGTQTLNASWQRSSDKLGRYATSTL